MRIRHAFAAVGLLAFAWVPMTAPIKPDLKVKALNAVQDGKRIVVETSVMNDSSWEFTYPGYRVYLTVFEDGTERTTVEPDFGKWRADETKTFRLPVEVVKGRSYRVLVRAEGLFGESNKENNVMEAVLMPSGAVTPAPPVSQPAEPPAAAGSLRITPDAAWAGSPILIEADKQGALKIGDLAHATTWTKGNGVDHTGAGVSAVVTLPSTSLRPGRYNVTLTQSNGASASAALTILGLPPRLLEVVGTPVPGKSFNVIADHVQASQVNELTLRAGENLLKATSHTARKDGSLSIAFTAPVNQYSGPVSLELDGASSSFWDTPRILFAGRPDLWSAAAKTHGATTGSVVLVWGDGLMDPALSWWLDGRAATVLATSDGTQGMFALLAAKGASGKTVEARAGKTRAAWLEVGAAAAPAPPAAQAPGAPAVEDFDPGAVRVGENLIITGARLGTARKVTVGGGSCDILEKSDGKLTVRVGPKAATGAIVVETDGGSATSDLSVVVR